MKKYLLLLSFFMLGAHPSPVPSGQCKIYVSVDLSQKIRAKKSQSFSDIKSRVNYLMTTLGDQICLEFVNYNFFEEQFIKINFNTTKVQTKFRESK